MWSIDPQIETHMNILHFLTSKTSLGTTKWSKTGQEVAKDSKKLANLAEKSSETSSGIFLTVWLQNFLLTSVIFKK